MHNRQPTMRSRELGEGLRRAMEAAGLTGVEAARRLDWSPSRVSRMLSGTRGTTEVDVAMFLTVCGVRGRERKRLLAVCQDQGVPGWLTTRTRPTGSPTSRRPGCRGCCRPRTTRGH